MVDTYGKSHTEEVKECMEKVEKEFLKLDETETNKSIDKYLRTEEEIEEEYKKPRYFLVSTKMKEKMEEFGWI